MNYFVRQDHGLTIYSDGAKCYSVACPVGERVEFSPEAMEITQDEFDKAQANGWPECTVAAHGRHLPTRGGNCVFCGWKLTYERTVNDGLFPL